MSCEVCEQLNPKYKCPGCSVKTCSLHCVKRHKVTRGCSGVRDKTAYVSMKAFTDGHLLNDYRFLEDVDRKAYSAITDDSAKQPRYQNKFHQLQNCCKSRKTWLKLLPPSFSRHKENTSWVNKREKKIYWRVHWIFPQSDAEYVDKSVCEEQTLHAVLATHLDPVKGDPVHRQRLKKYCQQGLEGLGLYMKVEGRPANSLMYHKLDLEGTLQENLSGKTLIEFPTIIVVLKESADSYKTTEQGQGTSLVQPESCTETHTTSGTSERPSKEGAATCARCESMEAQVETGKETLGELHAGKSGEASPDPGAGNSGKGLELPPEKDPTLVGKDVE